MKLIIAKDYAEMSRKGALLIGAQITLTPDSVLGFATGSTPIGMYHQLIEGFKMGIYDFSEVKTFNLDEYIGLGMDDEQSYIRFMKENLFDYINIPVANITLPNGKAEDPEAECISYEKKIRASGIDFQVLGIGHNGHIGFNEPNDHFVATTNVVELTQSTIDANARFFNSIDEVPKSAISMGINSIMQARQLVLLCSGVEKAQILYDSLYGPITPQIPASVLQLHKNLFVVADLDAANVILDKNK